ncbi:hypothetical protein L1987_01451 [Smallanthus sonchifolius]|uniref:Uncharacterized protein n=1 Tax=Smallanthus sonchifolius TaxID=185202 RepID=A0ACB9K566_9ASTR|nr:hypothetical protein L1987_01451 [Smallanthus sonchifolius]
MKSQLAYKIHSWHLASVVSREIEVAERKAFNSVFIPFTLKGPCPQTINVGPQSQGVPSTPQSQGVPSSTPQNQGVPSSTAQSQGVPVNTPQSQVVPASTPQQSAITTNPSALLASPLATISLQQIQKWLTTTPGPGTDCTWVYRPHDY